MFIAPFIIFFLVVYLYPFFKTIMMSFQRIDGPNHITWIAWSNYQKLFRDRNFFQSLMTTLRYAVWDLAILCTVPLIVAVILNSGYVKFPAFFKSVFFIPALTSTIVAGIVFRPKALLFLLLVVLGNSIGGLFIPFLQLLKGERHE